MNRPSEFRVWDNEFKFMRDDISNFLVNSQGELYENCYPEAYRLPDKFIKTDYTGLKDKNGKKIFEGDIVKYKWVTNFCRTMEGEKVGTVYWDKNNAGFLVQWRHNTHGVHIIGWNDLEVIGNIYENPELLKDKL